MIGAWSVVAEFSSPDARLSMRALITVVATDAVPDTVAASAAARDAGVGNGNGHRGGMAG